MFTLFYFPALMAGLFLSALLCHNVYNACQTIYPSIPLHNVVRGNNNMKWLAKAGGDSCCALWLYNVTV
jgi:hypothetical protein